MDNGLKSNLLAAFAEMVSGIQKKRIQILLRDGEQKAKT